MIPGSCSQNQRMNLKMLKEGKQENRLFLEKERVQNLQHTLGGDKSTHVWALSSVYILDLTEVCNSKEK